MILGIDWILSVGIISSIGLEIIVLWSWFIILCNYLDKFIYGINVTKVIKLRHYNYVPSNKQAPMSMWVNIADDNDYGWKISKIFSEK